MDETVPRPEETDYDKLTKLNRIEKSLNIIEAVLIHMSRTTDDWSDQKMSREAIRGHLEHIRKDLALPPRTTTRLPEHVCPMCERRFISGPVPLKKGFSLLDKRRNMEACPYCNTQQNKSKSIGERCDKTGCTGIVYDYFNRPTWYPKWRKN